MNTLPILSVRMEPVPLRSSAVMSISNESRRYTCAPATDPAKRGGERPHKTGRGFHPFGPTAENSRSKPKTAYVRLKTVPPAILIYRLCQRSRTADKAGIAVVGRRDAVRARRQRRGRILGHLSVQVH